jgi:threonine/homoserine/homoserine lactone efflux protein
MLSDDSELGFVGTGCGMKDAIQITIFFVVLFLTGLILVGPVLWSRQQFRRFLRNPRFSLRGLFFAFTIMILLCAAISLLILK